MPGLCEECLLESREVQVSVRSIIRHVGQDLRPCLPIVCKESPENAEAKNRRTSTDLEIRRPAGTEILPYTPWGSEAVSTPVTQRMNSARLRGSWSGRGFRRLCRERGLR